MSHRRVDFIIKLKQPTTNSAATATEELHSVPSFALGRRNAELLKVNIHTYASILLEHNSVKPGSCFSFSLSPPSPPRHFFLFSFLPSYLKTAFKTGETELWGQSTLLSWCVTSTETTRLIRDGQMKAAERDIYIYIY